MINGKKRSICRGERQLISCCGCVLCTLAYSVRCINNTPDLIRQRQCPPLEHLLQLLVGERRKLQFKPN